MRRRTRGGTSTAAPASDRPAGTDAGTDAGTARWPWLLAFGVVVIALVVGSVVAVVSFRTVSDVEDVAAGREAASTTATRFVRRANNFTSDQAQAYEESVLPLLTTAYAQEWRGRVAELEAYQQEDAVVTSEAQVTGTAVVTADVDSATVLVVADTSVEVVGSPLLGALRWEVDLFEVDGRWLVNDYRRVGPGGVVS